MSKLIDLTGQRFGMLTVIKRASDYISPSGNRSVRWLCGCDCGNEIVVCSKYLRNGHTKSCGCFRREAPKKYLKKMNLYDLSGECGVGYTLKGEPFYFDLEDYDKIKDYCWCIGKNGYVISSSNNKKISLHKLLMPNLDLIDHKDTNKANNQKSNLRAANFVENGVNKNNVKTNISGVSGVSYNSKCKKYEVYIGVDYVKKYLGIFSDFTEAALTRLEAEEVYFCEFMPLEHRKILAYIRNGGELECGNKELINKIVNDMI